MSSISRYTKQRLFEDEESFTKLLPFAKYDEEQGVFIHSDASLWLVYELAPILITKTSDAEAFHSCTQIQEMLDALDHTISVQVSWITTFDVEPLLKDSLNRYPKEGPAGYMARRWIRSLSQQSKSDNVGRRPRQLRLIMAFRYDPAWRAQNILQKLARAAQVVLKGGLGVTVAERRAEFLGYVNNFKSLVEGGVERLGAIGLRPYRIDAQGLIDLLYPILNRRSCKNGKLRNSRRIGIPVPDYDPDDFLNNQINETGIEHPKDGFIKKDGRYYRTVTMTKAPKQALPLMIAPLLSAPLENILTVTYSKQPKEKQLARLDALDGSLGLRERGFTGRANQKILHQISAIRAARQELYSNACQLVKIGVHQTFIGQTEDEVQRASSEAVAAFTQLNGARAMVHEIADLAALLTSLPGCYDPTYDGAGWTSTMRSSRAVRLFPLWGNWKGSQGSLFVLPTLWNRELVGFDLFDSNIAPNTLISGVSGAGKSYLLCYLLLGLNRGHISSLPDGSRVARQPITFVFDKGMTGQPCGFDKLARLFGGRIYEASPSKAPAMNFLYRLGTAAPDGRHEDYKDLIDLASDIIVDMASENGRSLDRLDRAAITESLIEAHRIYRSGPMRREFILSDVIAVLRAPARIGEPPETASRRQRISTLIADYYGEGTYARFFDRPGALSLKERFIVFDLKALSRNPDLQRVFLKVAMLWADTVMNDPQELDTRKVLVFDEAHDLIGKSGSNTVETAFRLYRKRKGMVIAASQSGDDFYAGEGGQAIVQNSAHKIFLRQDTAKFPSTARSFNLSQQQVDVITRLRTIKGVESQFYLISDIGEGAFVLPVEPAFYWVSTNNGDDNQLFAQVFQQMGGDFMATLQRLIQIAPNGAKSVRVSNGSRGDGEAQQDQTAAVVAGLFSTIPQHGGFGSA